MAWFQGLVLCHAMAAGPDRTPPSLIIQSTLSSGEDFLDVTFTSSNLLGRLAFHKVEQIIFLGFNVDLIHEVNVFDSAKADIKQKYQK